MAKGKELARNVLYLTRKILQGSNSFAFAPATQSLSILRNFLNAIFLRPLRRVFSYRFKTLSFAASEY
jgi:hypothetical protein